jgi:hypothetical protein
MNILDEDIGSSQSERLRAWKIHFRKIGVEIGRLGMKDHEQIIPLLHRHRRPTFFTQDHGFYHPKLCHAGYCLVYLDIFPNEVADYIYRFLRHPAFRTQAQRMGKAIRLRHSGLTYWQVNDRHEHLVSW